MLKRFFVFSWAGYEECGGWNDFQGSFETLEQAMSSPHSKAILADDEKHKGNVSHIGDCLHLVCKGSFVYSTPISVS